MLSLLTLTEHLQGKWFIVNVAAKVWKDYFSQTESSVQVILSTCCLSYKECSRQSPNHNGFPQDKGFQCLHRLSF